MASYFDEMCWTPLRAGETPNQLLHLVRLLRDFGMFDELGDGKRLPPPTSSSAIENLTKNTIVQEGMQCSVCLKNFELNEITLMLPCQHDFHSCCILPWLEKTSTCPLCRYFLPTDDEEFEEYKKAKIREKQREEDLDVLHNSMFS